MINTEHHDYYDSDISCSCNVYISLCSIIGLTSVSILYNSTTVSLLFSSTLLVTTSIES